MNATPFKDLLSHLSQNPETMVRMQDDPIGFARPFCEERGLEELLILVLLTWDLRLYRRLLEIEWLLGGGKTTKPQPMACVYEGDT